MTRPASRSLDVAVPGGRLRTLVWEPDGEPAGTIMAVHGITATHIAWLPLIDRMPDYRIVAPDLRGRGASNKIVGPWGMPRHADDLAQVAAEIGIDHAVWVGHSMGAFACVVAAHRHPELVSRLVLVDGGLPLPMPLEATPEDAVESVLGPAAKRLSMTFETPQDYQDFFRQHPSLGPYWNEAIEEYTRYDLQGHSPRFRPSTSYAAMRGDAHEMMVGGSLPAALAGLRHPALMLRAVRGMLDDDGGLYPAAYVAEWQARIALLRALDVPDTNHYTITLGAAGAAAIEQAVRDPQLVRLQ